MRSCFSIARVILVIGLIVAGLSLRETRADDAATAAVAGPNEVVDQIMGLIGQGKIDEAVGMMEGLKTQPELREAARDRLVRLRDEQGPYRGYDIAAVQRFTSQFETLDVLAYYDEQPVLAPLPLLSPADHQQRQVDGPGIPSQHGRSGNHGDFERYPGGLRGEREEIGNDE